MTASVAAILGASELVVRCAAPQPVGFRSAVVVEEGDVTSRQATASRSGLDAEALDRALSRDGEGGYVPFRHLRVSGADVRINSRGWRDLELDPARAPDAFRAIVVGDSVVFGYGVELEETFHKRAQRLLGDAWPGRRAEVAAFARHGQTLYGAETVLPGLIDFYRPDAVVVSVNLNDILVRPPPGRQLDLPWWLRGFQRLRFAADEIFYAHSHLYCLARDRAKRLLFRLGFSPDEMTRLAALHPEEPASERAWQESLAAVGRMIELASARGARALVLVLPIDPQLSPEHVRLWKEHYGLHFSDGLAAGLPQKMLCDFAGARGADCVDALPAMRGAAAASAEPLFFRELGGASDWNHPTAAGHAVIGRVLADTLRRAAPGLPAR
jgi:lysophospholipase L1-like esterase